MLHYVMFTASTRNRRFSYNDEPAEMSKLQLELLRLYGNNLSDETLLEVKKLLAKYFADRATHGMDDVWDEKGLTEQNVIDWTNEHNRSENRPRY